ncbi:MAG: hypothetical protein N4A68_14170 [Maledivibacter sp.]|jgi:hypothetical protein|nr:hypothetical protein [Maledivibacter sp.]
MTFLNKNQTIIRKSNGDILNFYVKEGCLFNREFFYKTGWDKPISIIEDLKHSQLDIKIDNNDFIYGIASNIKGEILYLFSNNNSIHLDTLFKYDINKYSVKYPYIEKFNNTITIAYYLHEIKHKREWMIAFHYFDGIKWSHKHIYSIKAFPIINPFLVLIDDKYTNIFYFDLVNGKEEIFIRQFSNNLKAWEMPIQLTNSNNQKLYLNVLKDKSGIYHITWSEFLKQNLVVRYLKVSLKENNFFANDIISLSEPANCSFPTFVKTGDALWSVWTQMDKLYSCYSLDCGNTWSDPRIDTKSENSIFIRYRFLSNNHQDLRNFNLNNIFGTSYPIMSFLGFKNIK